MKVSLLDNHKLIKLFSAIFELAPSLLRRWLICATTNLQLDHHWFNIEQKFGKLTKFLADVGLIPAAQAPIKGKNISGEHEFVLLFGAKKKTSNMLVTISLTNQLQVLSIEVLCLTSQLEDMLCNSTFSNKYICPWDLSPIATAKIGASWKTPVCPSTLAHPARKDYGSVNWVILITFNILMTLNPKKDTSIGLQRCGYLDRTQ